MENELGPATPKQVAFLQKRGINPMNWTKLKASQEIDRLIGGSGNVSLPPKPQYASQPQPSNNRENVIVAQCLTKCVAEMASSLIDAKAEDIGLCMPSIISVVWGAYKEFLSLLNGEAGSAAQ